jgi:hypothetical protein
MEGGVDRQGEVERRRLGRASLGNNSVALEASGKEQLLWLCSCKVRELQ